MKKVGIRLGFGFLTAFLGLFCFGCAHEQGVAGRQGGRAADGPGTAYSWPKRLQQAVDEADLDPEELESVLALIKGLALPCEADGPPKNLLEALQDEGCEGAERLFLRALHEVVLGKSLNEAEADLTRFRDSMKPLDLDFSGSPFFGNPKEAKHVIVEFFDYQCPACKRASEPLLELAEKHQAVIYYKMMPLSQHPMARTAALYALEAHRQGKFLAFSRHVFERQDELDHALLRELAYQSGMDLKRLDQALLEEGSGSLDALLERDQREIEGLDLRGTPSFFVDGVKLRFNELEGALGSP